MVYFMCMIWEALPLWWGYTFRAFGTINFAGSFLSQGFVLSSEFNSFRTCEKIWISSIVDLVKILIAVSSASVDCVEKGCKFVDRRNNAVENLSTIKG